MAPASTPVWASTALNRVASRSMASVSRRPPRRACTTLGRASTRAPAEGVGRTATGLTGRGVNPATSACSACTHGAPSKPHLGQGRAQRRHDHHIVQHGIAACVCGAVSSGTALQGGTPSKIRALGRGKASRPAGSSEWARVTPCMPMQRAQAWRAQKPGAQSGGRARRVRRTGQPYLHAEAGHLLGQHLQALARGAVHLGRLAECRGLRGAFGGTARSVWTWRCSEVLPQRARARLDPVAQLRRGFRGSGGGGGGGSTSARRHRPSQPGPDKSLTHHTIPALLCSCSGMRLTEGAALHACAGGVLAATFGWRAGRPKTGTCR